MPLGKEKNLVSITPPLSFMLHALRSIGYSLETAVADLVDNSISASAKNIDVSFIWGKDNNATHFIKILDDGEGMSRAELIAALNFSTKEVTEFRQPEDLGRFGLGLKLASFSQCKKLTIASKKNGEISCFRWDLNELNKKESQGLFIIEGITQTIQSELHYLSNKESGTLVVWENLDKIVSNKSSFDEYVQKEQLVTRHLAMVFHRFIEDNKFTLTVHGKTVKPWSPFPINNPATQYYPSTTIGIGNNVEVRGCILPPHEKVSSPEEYQVMGGNRGWVSQEGFYVYRNKRLLVSGSWLGLGNPRWIQEESYALVRIRIDISSADDFLWNIDVKKSMAYPPDDCRFPLEKIGAELRRKAQDAYLHRGNYKKGNVLEVKDIKPWKKQGDSFVINLESPFIKQGLNKLSEQDRSITLKMFRAIEMTVPIRQITITESEKKQGIASILTSKENKEKINSIKNIILLWMEDHHCSPEQAYEAISQMELFFDFPSQMRQALVEINQLKEANQ